MSEQRSLPVPDGLAGERVDAALAKLLGFSRTVRQATRRLVELVREWGPIQEMAIIHADNAGWASELVESLAEFLPSIPTIMDAGPTIVSHVGPGAVGVAALLAN